MDKEIEKVRKGKVIDNGSKDVEEVGMEKVIENKKPRKCKYYNKGHCNYKMKCRFIHPEQICKGHLITKIVR